MAVFCAAFPVLAGKVNAARQLAAECAGPRREDFAASQKRLGVTREQWFLQHEPDGQRLLVWFEADDLEHVFSSFATSTDPGDVWFKEQIRDITGLDLSAPLDAPPPEMIFDWRE